MSWMWMYELIKFITWSDVGEVRIILVPLSLPLSWNMCWHSCWLQSISSMFWIPGISWLFILILRLRYYASYVVERCRPCSSSAGQATFSSDCYFLVQTCLCTLFSSIDSLLNLDGSVEILGIRWHHWTGKDNKWYPANWERTNFEWRACGWYIGTAESISQLNLLS